LYLKLFVKQDCPKCPAAKEAVRGFAGEVQIFDLDQVEGLAEAAFYGIQCTPEVRAWRCEVPNPREIDSAAN